MESTSTSSIVALKALLAKQAYGEKLLTLSDVKAFVGACYQSLLHAARKAQSKYNMPHRFRPVYIMLQLHALTLPNLSSVIVSGRSTYPCHLTSGYYAILYPDYHLGSEAHEQP